MGPWAHELSVSWLMSPSDLSPCQTAHGSLGLSAAPVPGVIERYVDLRPIMRCIRLVWDAAYLSLLSSEQTSCIAAKVPPKQGAAGYLLGSWCRSTT